MHPVVLNSRSMEASVDSQVRIGPGLVIEEVAIELIPSSLQRSRTEGILDECTVVDTHQRAASSSSSEVGGKRPVSSAASRQVIQILFPEVV